MGMKARANVATFFKYFVLIFMGFIMVYPLLWMVGSTFKTNAEIFTSLSPFQLCDCFRLVSGRFIS